MWSVLMLTNTANGSCHGPPASKGIVSSGDLSLKLLGVGEEWLGCAGSKMHQVQGLGRASSGKVPMGQEWL